MQVLGDLIRLPKDGSSLPLPWWQRAPLGLLNGTNVHVGLVKSATRPVGDIVVSVLDINKWDNMLRLECSHPDQTGVLAGLIEAVLPLNIALAEAVTTETGEHHATLFCEDKGTQKVRDAQYRIQEELRKRGFTAPKLEPFLSPTPLPVLKSCKADVHEGWLQGIPFVRWIQERSDAAALNLVDLTQAVVSADTENRLLRFVFPYTGAKTVKVTHRDIPGALRQIFSEVMACNLNVLSALLRRGGQKENYAELIAACEPGKTDDQNSIYERLRERISHLDQRFDAEPKFADARPAEEVIYVPWRYGNVRGKHPVFLSQVTCDDDTNAVPFADVVRRELKGNLWLPLDDPTPRQAGELLSGGACALMERAEAAVFLLSGSRASIPEDRLLRLVHNIGYIRALCKPTLIISERVVADPLRAWLTGMPVPLVEVSTSDDHGSGTASLLPGVVSAWTRNVRIRP